MAKDDRLLAWVIIASQFAPPFMFSGVAVSLPSLGADLNAGATSLGLVETLFLAGSLSSLLTVGRLADLSDKKTLYKLGLLGFSLSSIAIGSISSMPTILSIRFLQGVASAVFSVTGPAILAEIVPAEERGKAYGRSLGAIYAGLTLGPICAGFLVGLASWRAVFFTGAGALLLAFLVVHAMLPSRWRRPQESIHFPSTGLIAAAVLCLVAGSAVLRHGSAGYFFLVVGLVLSTVFVFLQQRLKRPLIDVGALYRHRVLRNALLVQLLIYMNAFSSIFMLSIYIQISLGHSARTSGQVLAVGTVLMALLAPVAGSLSDRYRPRRIASFGVAGVLMSALMATTLGESSSLILVTFILTVQAVGFAFFASPNMTLVMGSVPASSANMASALSAKSRSIGAVSGMLVTAVLISLRIGNDPVAHHPRSFIDVMGTAFSIFAGLAALGLTIAFLTRERLGEA